MPFAIYSPIVEKSGSSPAGPPGNHARLLFLVSSLIIVVGLVLLYSMEGEADFLQWKDGEADLSDARKEKLERELEELEAAEQYVLFARRAGYFPCFNCPGKTQIFLNLGEVWKYGVTTKKETGRYKQGLPDKRLAYLVQYQGPLQECLRREKIKIYYYATLPENLKRNPPLIRPPGNKVDR